MKSLSRVRLLATPWTSAYQAPLSVGFSRQEYWSGVPLPSPKEHDRDAFKVWFFLFFFSNYQVFQLGFPGSSVGKESTCNAGNPGSIPGSGRSTGDGIGYPLQYCWASLVAQLVKNPPAVWETWVWSLVWEDPLEKGKVTHSNILAWRIPWTIYSMGLQRIGHDWVTFTLTFTSCLSPVAIARGIKLIDKMLQIRMGRSWMFLLNNIQNLKV